MRFRQISIVQRQGQHLRMSFGHQDSGNAPWPATRKSNLLSERQLRQPGNDLHLRLTLDFYGNRRRKRELNQIHQIHVAQETQSNQSGSARMGQECFLYRISFEELLLRPEFLQNFGRKILARQKQTHSLFAERGIVQQRQQNSRRGMIEKFRKGIAGTAARFLNLLLKLRHDRFSRRLRAPAAAGPCAPQLLPQSRPALQIPHAAPPAASADSVVHQNSANVAPYRRSSPTEICALADLDAPQGRSPIELAPPLQAEAIPATLGLLHPRHAPRPEKSWEKIRPGQRAPETGIPANSRHPAL